MNIRKKKELIIACKRDNVNNIKEVLKDSKDVISITQLEGKKVFNQKYLFIPIIIIFFLSTFLTLNIFAEQIGSSPESGTDSKFTQLYDELVTLGIGTEGSGAWGDWGSRWNRIMSASKRDLVNYEAMSLQQRDYRDTAGYGSASWAQWELTNSAIGKNVYRSRRTELYWSPAYSAMTNNFTISTCPFFSMDLRGNYDGTGSTCGDAINYCGLLELDANGDSVDDTKWYLPTQAELLRAYADGIYLGTNTAWATTSEFWSATEGVMYLTFSMGYQNTAVKTSSKNIRCVLRYVD